jgi:DNA-directed RNA polymerase specialized sigma24 family protein
VRGLPVRTGFEMRAPIQIEADPVDQEPDIAAAIRGLADTDLTRLRALGRLRARTLPGIDWSDLLHEAIVRALDGSRRWTPSIPLVAFLAGIMRSIGDDHRRRLAQERTWLSGAENNVIAGDLEEGIIAGQSLNAIFELFAADATIMRIIEGLAYGRSAREIRAQFQMSETEYDSGRKRLRRALLRLDPEGGRK